MRPLRHLAVAALLERVCEGPRHLHSLPVDLDGHLVQTLQRRQKTVAHKDRLEEKKAKFVRC